MKVKELIEKLNEYNQASDVEICVNGMPQKFEICYGTAEGCTKLTCDCVDFMVGTVCDKSERQCNK